ncbi:MAG: hypothetical protein MI807_07715 [Verrucomicrobiales bacterium]|nr:hypothetical protein [Verrucomicrobiales bacterium]
MKRFPSILLLSVVLTLGACTGKKEKEVPEDWHPEQASVARHITSVHGFTISEKENSHLRVEKVDKKIVATFREDVLKDLGGEKALYVFAWEQNPQTVSRAEYLYFLEALHAYLVLNAPKWDGGEGASTEAPKADS